VRRLPEHVKVTVHFRHVSRIIMCVAITVLPLTCLGYYCTATHVFRLLLYCRTGVWGYYFTATHVFRLLLYCRTGVWGYYFTATHVFRLLLYRRTGVWGCYSTATHAFRWQVHPDACPVKTMLDCRHLT
jgi:hypothetical protein